MQRKINRFEEDYQKEKQLSEIVYGEAEREFKKSVTFGSPDTKKMKRMVRCSKSIKKQGIWGM